MILGPNPACAAGDFLSSPLQTFAKLAERGEGFGQTRNVLKRSNKSSVGGGIAGGLVFVQPAVTAFILFNFGFVINNCLFMLRDVFVIWYVGQWLCLVSAALRRHCHPRVCVLGWHRAAGGVVLVVGLSSGLITNIQPFCLAFYL